jgi:large subunit ribosomal protein L18|uniref:ribosomal protein L18 n=1 Tax=Cryptomonas gyropyrenoidosa TaxID=233257 RepID=UPI00279EAE44|nr:ribosomal protein L18 [Cryptomonas gyropyrenoidosa]WFQ83014.1 ribosomal protein L18 [Cryptomonas gyropyrenoidosa]
MSKQSLQKTKRRIREKVRGTAERPRLCVFRSHNNIYAQLIDDDCGKTLVSSSTLEKSNFPELKSKANCETSALVGKLIAKKSLESNIVRVVFDRGGKPYHGRIKSLADAAREEGLKF